MKRTKTRRRASARRSIHHHRGFTLVETMTAMSIMVILLGGMTSAIMVASRAIDDGTSPATITAEAADTVAEISEEITLALHFDEITRSTVSFIVPDRDNDGVPEKIRYAWSEVPGDPLTREYNGGSPEKLVERVDHFGLSNLVRSVTPPPQACCQTDGTCSELTMEACAAVEGESYGPRTDCSMVTCPVPGRALLVVADAAAPTADETARQTLIESWGFGVVLISSSSTQEEFDAAMADVEVVYLSALVDPAKVGTKLTSATIGVVNANAQLMDDLEYAAGAWWTSNLTDATIVDNTHYITSPLALGTFVLATSSQLFIGVLNGQAPGLQTLGTIDSGRDSLYVIDTGGQLVGGTPAPGRRVQLFWGNSTYDLSALTADSLTIFQRSLEWAGGLEDAGAGTVCGDAICQGGEDPCTCPADCGAPDAFEQPGVTCFDGIDNDCDGQTDCSDLNCVLLELQCTCGDGLCQSGEDCNNCASDCPGITSGKKSNQYCCGNGILEAAEGDGTICDFNP